MSSSFIKMSVRSVAILAGALANQVGRPVVDRTGFTGNFEFNLDWSLDLTGEPIPQNPRAPAPIDRVSVFTALEEQLGLKLQSERGPLEVLVIDHVEPPTPD
jgi:uncharacterized protein (TIGR03435 family)